MRNSIAYYLMLLYITIMFKPFIPAIKDTLSHTFSEAIHIAIVHAKYGANHLAKEVAATGSDNSSGNQNILSIESASVHITTTEWKYNFNLKLLNKDYPAYLPYILTSVFISKAGPPPKFS